LNCGILELCGWTGGNPAVTRAALRPLRFASMRRKAALLRISLCERPVEGWGHLCAPMRHSAKLRVIPQKTRQHGW